MPVVIKNAISSFPFFNFKGELFLTLEKYTPTITAVKYPSLSPTTFIGYGM